MNYIPIIKSKWSTNFTFTLEVKLWFVENWEDVLKTKKVWFGISKIWSSNKIIKLTTNEPVINAKPSKGNI